MRRLLVLALCLVAHSVSAQTTPVEKSVSSKFFIGGGIEGTSISTDVAGTTATTTTESGTGAGLVIGYGFSPMWAIYGQASGANISAVGGSYGLGHFDVGARVHFRTGPNVVVPFVQFGISGRAVSEDFTDRTGTHTITASGAGLAIGGGLNAHFTPAFAFSASIALSLGNFTNFTVSNIAVASDAINATSARVQVGVIWFPQAHAK